MLVAVGSYTEPAGHVHGGLGAGIATFWADVEGHLSPTGAAVHPARNPTYLARHPKDSVSVLYAAHETTDWAGAVGEASAVSALGFDPATGELWPLGQVALSGAVACHLDCDGSLLVVACYIGVSGHGLVHAIETRADGTLGPLLWTVAFTGSSGASGDASRGGVDAGRQDSPHPHMALIVGRCGGTGGPRSVLVPDLGADVLHRLHLDRAGALVQPGGGPGEGCAGGAPTVGPETPGALRIPVGSGPRHCVVGGDGRHAYVVSELTSTVDVVSLGGGGAGAGAMRCVQRVSSLPASGADLSGNPVFQLLGQSQGAAIRLSPCGRALYVSNRGHDTITSLPVLDDGTLDESRQSWTPAGGRTPRDFFVDPGGRYVLALAQDSGRISRLPVAAGQGGPPCALTTAPEGEVPVEVPAPVTMVALARRRAGVEVAA